MKDKPKIDPFTCNVPNVCFTLINQDDKRWSEYEEQRLTRGFDDSETWSLDFTIAKFIVPRLERYIEIYKDTLVDHDGFLDKAERALKAFKLIATDKCVYEPDEYKEITEALHGFADIFVGLWW